MPDQPTFIKTLRLEGFPQKQGQAPPPELTAQGFDFKKKIRLALPQRQTIRKADLKYEARQEIDLDNLN